MPLPDGFEVRDDGPHGTRVALAGDPPGAVVTVTREPLVPGAPLAPEATATPELRIVHQAETELGARPAVRTLGSLSGATTVDEWRFAAGPALYTVAAACATARYPELEPAFAALAAGVRPAPADDRPPSPERWFDPASGILVTRAAELEALIAHDRPDPALERTIGVLRAPVMTLTLTRGAGPALRGAADTSHAALVTPLDGDWVRLDRVATATLPDALARAVGLEPRPPADAAPLTFPVAELARRLASPAPAGDPLAGVRAHWRLEARWEDSAAVLEVLDTDAGLWLIRAAGDQVELTPATTAEVWRHLAPLAAAVPK